MENQMIGLITGQSFHYPHQSLFRRNTNLILVLGL